MKNWFLWLISICVCLMASNGFALTITDPGVVGTIEAGTQNASLDNEIDWAQYLLDLGVGATATADGNDPLDGVSENYETTSPTDYSGTLTGGIRINESTPTDLDIYEYVLGKYDGQNAGYVLFYMPVFGGDTIPELSHSIWGDEGQYQLSHTTVYNRIPEPSLLVLLGFSLLGLAGTKRKLKK